MREKHVIEGTFECTYGSNGFSTRRKMVLRTVDKDIDPSSVFNILGEGDKFKITIEVERCTQKTN